MPRRFLISSAIVVSWLCAWRGSAKEPQPLPAARSAPSHQRPRELSLDDGDEAFDGPYRRRGLMEIIFGEHYDRDIGLGEPLVGGSWLNRPLSVSALAGVVFADDPTTDIDQKTGTIGGFRIGWDLGDYWGAETRLAFAELDVRDTTTAVDTGNGNIQFWDIDFLYYPLGDSRWRPYFTWGLGVAAFEFYNASGRKFEEGVFAMPIGGGFKYRAQPWWAFRLDAVDNIAFGNEAIGTMHNFSLTLSLEYRFGGSRRSYWPWNPTLSAW